MKNLIFISAFNPKWNELGTSNEAMHEGMTSILKHNNLKFKEVDGVYKGESEKSFMIELTGTHTVNFFKTMANLFNQESFLWVDSEGNSMLFFNNGDTVELGKMQIVDENEAKNSEAYTFIPENNTYLLAKQA